MDIGTFAGRGGLGIVKLLIMGSGAWNDIAIARHLCTLTALPDERVVTCDDPALCDVMIVHAHSAMRKVARRIASLRPALPLWVLNPDGSFHDGLSERPTVLDSDALHGVLSVLGAGAIADTSNVDPVAADVDAALICDAIEAADSSLVLSLDGAPLVRLDFAQGIAVPLIDAPHTHDALARAFGQSFHRIRMVLGGGPDHHAAASAASLPLIPLLWETALHLPSPVALLSPIDAKTALQITRWPDFRTIARRPDHFRVCSLLLRRPCTAAETAALLQLDHDVVVPVFNAIYLSGYARLVASAPTLSVPAKHVGTGSMLAKMWRHVRVRIGG